MRIQCLSVVLFALLTAVNGEARTIVIPRDYQSIQAGINASRSGDTILVARGGYRENISIGNHNITLTSAFAVSGDPADIDSTILQPAGNNRPIILIDHEFPRQISVMGFTILNGNSWSNGGGIAILNGARATLADLIFRDNRASSHGGGVACEYGSLDGRNLVFERNHCGQAGGGMSIRGARAVCTLTDVLFYQNSATAAGGGLLVGNTHAVLNRVTFVEDSSDYGGGLFCDSNPQMELTDCSFSSNYARLWGGGFCLDDQGTVSMNRVAMSSNFARQNGGAIVLLGARFTLNGLTLVGNNADSGKTVFIDYGSSGSLRNSVLVGEVNTMISCRAGGAPNSITVSYCDLQGGQDAFHGNDNLTVTWGDGNIDLDPQFADPATGDYRLRADSPCIDAGDPNAPLDPDGTRSDMGAFPFHQRDIAVDTLLVHFPASEWGQLDSLPVSIRNVGETDLRISSILNCNHISCIFTAEFPDTEIVVSPDSAYILWVYFRPDSQAAPERSIQITSDDPVDSVIVIEATGDFPNGVTGDGRDARPTRFELLNAFPNPFNSSTTISYTLPAAGWTEVDVVDIEGRRVSELARGRVSTGAHSVVWNAEGVPAGIYLVRVKAGEAKAIRKVVLVR